MTCHVPPPTSQTAAPDTLLLGAARCWRAARDAGQPVQPCLFHSLDQWGCGLLAPVFDSLLLLCEAALGRRLATGAGTCISQDELLLLGLVDGTRTRRACFDCAEGAASALDCAICSTRIMMTLTMGRSVGHPGRDYPVAAHTGFTAAG